MKQKLFIGIGIIFLLSQITAVASMAQTGNPTLDETLSLRMGPFLANMDASVNVYGQDLKVDDKIDTGDVDFAINGLWRITKRIRFEAGYSSLDKKSGDTLDSDIDLGTVTIPAGADLDGKLETSVLRGAFGYALYRGESSEFGVDLGVNYTTIKEAFYVNSPGLEGTQITYLDVSQPLPTIGLFFNYAFSPQWCLTTRAGIFSMDIGDVDGTVFDIFGGLEYRPWQHVGLGLAYTYTSADVTIEDNNNRADVEYDYHGPYLYLVVGF